MKVQQEPRGQWLRTLGTTSAATSAALFLLGVIAPIADAVHARIGEIVPAGRNWLVLLFELNAGLGGVRFDLLRGRNALDIVLMVLVALALVGLSRVLSRGARVGALVGVALVAAGVVLFILTSLTGRSSVMAALLVASAAMLWDRAFRHALAPIGIASGALLLAGDIATRPDAQSIVIAVALGAGYLLLTAWLVLVARRLWRAERGVGDQRRPLSS